MKWIKLSDELPTLTIRHLCITIWDCLYQTKLNTSGNIGVCFQINRTNNEGGDEV